MLYKTAIISYTSLQTGDDKEEEGTSQLLRIKERLRGKKRKAEAKEAEAAADGGAKDDDYEGAIEEQRNSEKQKEK